MKIRTVVISIAIIFLLTISSLFIKIIPCKSWIAANTEAIGTFPHNTFCDLSSSSISSTYYYITSSPTYAFLITLVIFSIIVFIASFIFDKRQK